MHGNSVKYKTCTFSLRLRTNNHRRHLSSYYSSGDTDTCTAAVRQGLIQTLLSQCKTLTSFNSVWRSITAFKHWGQLTSAITLQARFTTREVREKPPLLSAVIGLRSPFLNLSMELQCPAHRRLQETITPAPCLLHAVLHPQILIRMLLPQKVQQKVLKQHSKKRTGIVLSSGGVGTSLVTDLSEVSCICKI